MTFIDRQYTETPYYSSRRMAAYLKSQGFDIGRKRTRTFMETMGLEAIDPKPKLELTHEEHEKYPYLLRGIVIDRVDPVWSSDITFIPLEEGFGYLMAIIDWYSRYVIEWELSNLIDTDFCLRALERSLEKGTPEIFNTDQGSQLTSGAFTGKLEAYEIQISMDGRGRVLDNIFVERPWRSVKYEDVYLRGYRTLKEAREGLKRCFEFYNRERVHQSLGYKTPLEAYTGKIAPPPLARAMEGARLGSSGCSRLEK